jgi:hypothetical protein
MIETAWIIDDEEQEQFLDWYEDAELPTIGTPEEAYAVALSLSDAEIEQVDHAHR